MIPEPHLDTLLERARRQGLSPSLLDRAIKTRWIVITGTFSAGKTTLVNALSETLSVRAVREPARAVLREQAALAGVPRSQVWTLGAALIRPMHRRRVQQERDLDPQEFAILDTAIPDTLAYALYEHLALTDLLPDIGLFRYQEPILMLQPHGFVADGLRKEDERQRHAIHYLRRAIYEQLGYRVHEISLADSRVRIQQALRSLGIAGST